MKVCSGGEAGAEGAEGADARGLWMLQCERLHERTGRIEAVYWIETAFPLQQAAETMAGEQSTGTFLRVPGETDELRERHAARIENLRELDSTQSPSLPGAGVPQAAAVCWLSARTCSLLRSSLPEDRPCR